MFSDHLFTFALSRLTGHLDFTPALPVLFGWIKYTKRIHYLQYNTYTYFCCDR